MPRSYAKVLGSIWRDDDWRALTESEQRFYMLLLSQPEITNCGVVPYVPTRWVSMARDTTLADVFERIAALVDRGFILVNEDTAEVLIRTFIRHDKVWEQPKLHAAARREYDQIQCPAIRSYLFETYPHLLDANEQETPANKTSPGNGDSLVRNGSALDLDLNQDLALKPLPLTAGPSPSPNGLPFAQELLVGRIMAYIGDHADDGTAHVIRVHALHLSESALAKALESAKTTQPENRAKYIVGALTGERAEIGAAA